ncbi:MAG: hypothetical protein ACR2FH_05170, partial [Caulobacteraceae bacterium]
MTQIHWLDPVSGNFDTAADWSGGLVPGATDDAILDAAGSSFTVTAPTGETVNSIRTAANAILAITGGTFAAATGAGSGANAGTIEVEGGAKFQVGGTLLNTGAITLVGSMIHGHKANLIVQGSVTLDGGGTVSLTENKSLAVIEGKRKNAVLINIDNTISGSGQIGNGVNSSKLSLINEAGGVINANDPSHLLHVLNDRPSINAGLMEATSGATLLIERTTINNTGGTIEAVGRGTVGIADATIEGGGIFAGTNSVVALDNSANISGAALSIATAGKIEIFGRAVITADGGIFNSGTILLQDNSTAGLVLDNSVSLTGGGTVTLVGGGIDGTTTAAVLNNLDNTIGGYGRLGGGVLTLVNQAGGVIDANVNTLDLTIDTGTRTIANAGLIEATARGLGVVASPIRNTGILEATGGGTLTVNGAVTGGTGKAMAAGGTLDFTASFNQNVIFSGAGSVLELAQSQSYGGKLRGFSRSGRSTLDLADIGFVDAGEATYSGTTTSGILTVTDGTHTAHIALRGNYLNAIFTASTDGHGGTDIVASKAAASVHRFVAAAAGRG